MSPSTKPRSRTTATARSAQIARRRTARISAVVAVLAVAIGGAVIVNRPVTKAGGHSKHAHPKTASAACGAQPPAHKAETFPHPPSLRMPAGADFRAIINTSCGEIDLDLLEKTAPKTVANFVFLARHGFYDGRLWFRIENNSVIQTGDPNDLNGVAPDGPGYTIPDELPKKSHDYVFGVVGMANTGQPHSGGSQFFIVIHHNEPAGYDPRYSIFGKVDPGSYDVLDRLGAQPTFGGTDPIKSVTPVTPVFIDSVKIIQK